MSKKVRITKDEIYKIQGIQMLEREIAADFDGVARKMRKAARNSADAAEDSLQKDLSKHVRTGELYRSIQSVIAKEGPNRYSASTSVGLDVEHSIYFFEDTREGVKNLFNKAGSDKLYGPTNDGRGPQYLHKFKGYKGHENYIFRAQKKARRVIDREVKTINRNI